MSSVNNNPSTTDQDVSSKLTEAVRKVDAEQIDKNLQQAKETDAPEHLTDSEETPFIDDEQRTDK